VNTKRAGMKKMPGHSADQGGNADMIFMPGAVGMISVMTHVMNYRIAGMISLMILIMNY
jgi:hypothetical protein